MTRLATGTAEQLGTIIDFCEHKFDQVDAMVTLDITLKAQT